MRVTVSNDATIASTYLNTLSINGLLLGVYTAVYFRTLYIYLSSKMPHNFGVISAITALYLLNVGQVAKEWAWVDILFGMVDVYSDTEPDWSYLVSNVNALLLGATADTLLMWRCYNVWNCSFRVILLPAALFLLEIGTGIANIVKISIDQLNPETYSAGPGLQIQTTLGIFLVFAQTLLTTSLILYRIITVTRHAVLTKQTYNTCKNILDLVVQSSAVYSVVLLIWAVASIATRSPGSIDALRQAPGSDLNKLIEELTFVAAGMAPTVMVARIAHARKKDLDREIVITAHMSDLEFGAETRDVILTMSVPAADGISLASESD